MAATYLLDTSCLVPLVCGWHEHHADTRADLERRQSRGERAVLAAPSLVETYAVLTRLPPPHRVSHAEALALMEANWSNARIVALDGEDHWRTLRRARDLAIRGGQSYDAIIAACATKARVNVVVTWNLDHFKIFADVVPVVAPRGETPIAKEHHSNRR